MKTGYKILGLLLIVVLFLFYQYVRHVQYLDKLTVLSNQITSDYGNFCSNYSDCIPKVKADLQTMIEWALLTSGDSKNSSPYSILEDRYEVKYDSTKRIATIYAYGLNGNDDFLANTPYNAVNTNIMGQYPIYQGSFLRFLLDYFTDLDADVVLARLEDLEPMCPNQENVEDLRYLRRQLEIYSGGKTLLGTPFELEFRNKLLHFMLDFDKRHPLSNIGENGPVVIKYKNDKIEFVCDGALSEEEKETFINELNANLFQIKSLTFDYALIPIYVSETARNIAAETK